MSTQRRSRLVGWKNFVYHQHIFALTIITHLCLDGKIFVMTIFIFINIHHHHRWSSLRLHMRRAFFVDYFFDYVLSLPLRDTPTLESPTTGWGWRGTSVSLLDSARLSFFYLSVWYFHCDIFYIKKLFALFFRCTAWKASHSLLNFSLFSLWLLILQVCNRLTRSHALLSEHEMTARESDCASYISETQRFALSAVRVSRKTRKKKKKSHNSERRAV